MPTGPKSYTYNTSVAWKQGLDGALTSPGMPDVPVSAPVEFRGSENTWSPECLFVASVETCLMLTFVLTAKARKVEFVSYQSKAEGLLELLYGKRVISSITVRPRIAIKAEADREKIQAIVDRMEEECYISNSIETEVTVEAEIVVGG